MTERRYDGLLNREIPLFAQHCIRRIESGGRDESSLRQVLFRFVFPYLMAPMYSMALLWQIKAIGG